MRSLLENIEETCKRLARLQEMLTELPQEQMFTRLGLEPRIHQLSSIPDRFEKCHTVNKRLVSITTRPLLFRKSQSTEGA